MDASLFDRMARAEVAVAGDVLLDRFVEGNVSRVSPEAPVAILKHGRETERLGGAGNVAANLVAYGTRTVLVGARGDDAGGRALQALCDATPGLTAVLVTDPLRPTTVKTRYMGGWHQLLRVDAETSDALPAEQAEEVLAAVGRALETAQILVLSDYDKGVLPAAEIRKLIDAARAAGRPVIVDPKKRDPKVFAGAAILKPNIEEMALFTGLRPRTDEDAAAAGLKLAEIAGVEAVLLTRGEAGLTLVQTSGAEPLHVRAETHRVFDVTGAGDSVIATLSSALAAGADLETAVRMANAAAGVAVAKPGTTTVSPSELREALALEFSSGAVSREEAARQVADWTGQGMKVGFTNGCFDLLHRGHLYSLRQAAGRVDRLVVGVNSDASTRALKGPGRPVQDEDTRAAVLAALRLVDLVVIFDEPTPEALIEALAPNVLFKGADYAEDQVAGAAFVKAGGGRVELLPLLAGHSTTATVARLTGADD